MFPRSRKFYLSLLGVVAWSTTAADTILNILDAASLPGTGLSHVELAAAASALDLVGLSSVTVFSAQYAWTREGIIKHSVQGRRILVGCCTILSATGVIVSLAALLTIKTSVDKVAVSRSSAIDAWNSRLAARIAVWALVCISQIVLYSSLLWSKPKPKVQPVIVSGPRDSVMSEIRHSNQTADLYILEPTQPLSPLAALPSPTFSARSSQSLQSWKDSLQQVVRPVTSRTKLISRPSFNRDARSIYSEGQSVDASSQKDGFDSWEVDNEAVMQLASASPSTATCVTKVEKQSKRPALETIPGSRPASPAHALDGPFPEFDEDDAELRPPPKMMPDTSRPPSPVVSEAHIHPLFRTESPTPPPGKTPGTTIVASPLSNQMIACPPRSYNRMRSNSRGASPSPLVHSRSFIHERAISPPTQSRSPSPPGREMTPPIPDFVLNSSPRSSLSGSQYRRKVNLQTD